MPVTRDKTERPHGALLQLDTGFLPVSYTHLTLKNEQCRLEDSLREEFRVILDKDRDIGQKDIAPQAELKEKN